MLAATTLAAEILLFGVKVGEADCAIRFVPDAIFISTISYRQMKALANAVHASTHGKLQT